MAIQSGSSLPKLKPTVTTNPAGEFNQNQARLYGTISANKYPTTVVFDYSTSPTFATYSSTSTSSGSTQNFSVNTVIFSLTPATTYYIRCRATNAIGTTIGNTVSFTTWSLKTFTQTTAGSFLVSIPSIPGVAPTIYEMLLYGGGGGANYGGGGGGGYRLFSSYTSTVTGTQNIGGTVGAGGAAGNGGTGTGSATAGGSTTLTIGSTSWIGGGGTAGEHPGNCGAPFGRGGTVGAGTNGANLGGTNTYGYYTIVSYTCNCFDKLGNCCGSVPNYGYDCGYYACGGGGGTDAAGGNACCQDSSSHVGGNGGTGGGAYGLRGGNGGGGQGTQGNGSAGGFSVGSGTICGSGGSVFSAGSAGGITFKYYGP